MSDDRDKGDDNEREDGAGWLKSRWQVVKGIRRRRRTPTLFGLMGLPGQSGAHWAGNINVLIGKKAVERHLAQALTDLSWP